MLSFPGGRGERTKIEVFFWVLVNSGQFFFISYFSSFSIFFSLVLFYLDGVLIKQRDKYCIQWVEYAKWWSEQWVNLLTQGLTSLVLANVIF